MLANGPAIKGVSVAERVKAGAEKPNRGNVPAPAGMSEAWRGFCRPVASFVSFTSVAVQCFLWAKNLSTYTDLIESSGAVTVMSPYTVFSWEQERFAKTVTSLITFIVRVSISYHSKSFSDQSSIWQFLKCQWSQSFVWNLMIYLKQWNCLEKSSYL